MMQPAVIAIRPEPGLSQTIDRAADMGLTVTGHPLFEVKPVTWSAPDNLAFDALLIGSANAIRHGGPQLALLLDIPVYAVGETTAKTARDAGFDVAGAGAGGLQAVLDSLSHKAIKFLRLTGRDHVDLAPPRSHTIVDRIVYKSCSLPISEALAAVLGKGAVVMLHSAVAAEHFVNECSRMGLDRTQIRIAALGPRIADAAGDGWAEVAVAEEPSDATLLALTKNMCQNLDK